jgi:hypothetical protein
MTNAALSVLALVLVWKGSAPKIGIGIVLIISIAFLMSLITGPLYGGSMLNSDGSEMALAGVNIAVLIVAILTVLLVMSYRALSRQTRS